MNGNGGDLNPWGPPAGGILGHMDLSARPSGPWHHAAYSLLMWSTPYFSPHTCPRISRHAVAMPALMSAWFLGAFVARTRKIRLRQAKPLLPPSPPGGSTMCLPSRWGLPTQANGGIAPSSAAAGASPSFHGSPVFFQGFQAPRVSSQLVEQSTVVESHFPFAERGAQNTGANARPPPPP